MSNIIHDNHEENTDKRCFGTQNIQDVFQSTDSFPNTVFTMVQDNDACEVQLTKENAVLAAKIILS